MNDPSVVPTIPAMRRFFCTLRAGSREGEFDIVMTVAGFDGRDDAIEFSDWLRDMMLKYAGDYVSHHGGNEKLN